MLTTGKLSADALPDDLASSDFLLGMEFAGLDEHGRRVMGIVPVQGLATAVAVDPTFLWEVPETWSLQQAATVPMVYATAYYALLVHGHMRPGESVLIHSGSGGVGQAAISIALSMGCTVFTTVGVDLVLNSLAEDKLQASIRCLATHGRFLEIGKVDMSNDSPLKMSVFLKGVTFHGVVFEHLHGDAVSEVEERRLVAEYIRAGIASGAVRPLDAILFPHDQMEDAFRFMASGKHIGKIVLELLRDGLIENQTAEAFETVMKIKINGTRHLDELSRKMCPELDHFVAFSSLSSGVGNVGQTNYGYANSAMERICEIRAAQGLPGMAIQWGAIADVGAFHDKMGDDATIAGSVPQRISSCIALMDLFLNQHHPVVSSCVKADVATEINRNKGGIVEVIARILGVKEPSRLNPATSLGELGMDSLMAVEVRQAIERHISLTLSMKEIRQLTIEGLQKLSQGTTASKHS
ncbi:hypothetical protein HPB52_000277 [Rhipicephalus sanguineus]|uniref:Fatty acid synthase n=1 Tax=Rhipicephalus sanguineus TaxID=34632 RepID=A0A9D4PTF4_RHISA|nr:hypothetical protein HPB52_000277 [Rhipicephalus sanguineus]